MAKRRAEEPLLHHSPSKRCYRSFSSVDMQLDSMAPTAGGVSLSPPSLFALLGSRCRKRPHYFEDPEKKQEEEEGAAALCRRLTHCDTSRKHAANASVTVQDRRTSSKKRAREDCTSAETVTPKAKADKDANSEDCTYNSFQYWRVPLPELDLSLLEDTKNDSQTKDKSKFKDSSLDAMET